MFIQIIYESFIKKLILHFMVYLSLLTLFMEIKVKRCLKKF